MFLHMAINLVSFLLIYLTLDILNTMARNYPQGIDNYGIKMCIQILYLNISRVLI